MSSQIPERYWDSDCFLAWLQSEPNKTVGCEEVLNAAAAGNLLIVTSAFTLTEVLNLKGKSPIPSHRRDEVVRFFQQPYIRVVPLFREIAETAREVVWDHGIHPKDATHVASAISAKVPLLNTFDRPLIGKSGVTVDGYRLTIERPHFSHQGNLIP